VPVAASPDRNVTGATAAATDLGWVFTEKLKSFRGVAPLISIAIVPTKDG
jgi:hypothetical protein